jgi:hypothetical protein
MLIDIIQSVVLKFRFVNLRFHQPDLIEKMHKRRAQYAHPVFHAAAEIDGAGLGEIFGGAGDLPNFKSRVKDLRDHLVIEHKIVGVGVVIDLFEHLPGKGAVAGVVF